MSDFREDIPVDVQYYDSDYTFDEDVTMVESLGREHPGEWLELGCGTGRLMIPLAERGCTLTGVDNDSRMLDRAQDKIAALSD